MARAFKLPDLGEGIHEGEVLSVFVSVGDEVKEGDPICEVETDKAAVEIPSPFTGKVAEILVKPGDQVKVGDVLMTFGDGEKDVKPPVEDKAPEKETMAAPMAEAIPPPPAPVEKEGPVPASPATRRLARELGVGLRRVTPTGPGGLVTAEDVRTFAQAVPKPEEAAPAESAAPSAVSPLTAVTPPPLPDFTRWGEVERMPVRSIRKATAKQMALSWSQIPHVTSHDEVDLTRLDAFRRKHKADIEDKGGKLSITVFALKAAATALKAYPNFNASMDTAAGELVFKHYFHIGVAVNTDGGLIVPVIRDVDRKSITELAVELNELVERTRERKATLEEMQGGSFTITNVGPMGGGHFTPIINYPEVAILGMGSGGLKPVVVEGKKGIEILPRLMMPVSLTIDHRVLDGADALKFMRVIKDDLQDPDALLMTMV